MHVSPISYMYKVQLQELAYTLFFQVYIFHLYIQEDFGDNEFCTLFYNRSLVLELVYILYVSFLSLS